MLYLCLCLFTFTCAKKNNDKKKNEQMKNKKDGRKLTTMFIQSL